MTKDIRGNIRQVIQNDSARAILATATGELIKRLGDRRHQPEQPDTRVVAASGLGGFAAGAGAVTLASVATKRVRSALGRRRRPLFADVPRKAAKGTRRAVEVPVEAVDRFASGLRDQIGGRSQSSSGTRSGSGGRSTRSGAKSANRSRAGSSSPRSSRRASGATSGRKSGTSGARTSAKSTRSANGAKAKSTSAKSTRSANGAKSRSASPARAKASKPS
jgi:hypothetical protein